MDMIKVLFLAANPAVAPIRIDEEIREITNKIQAAPVKLTRSKLKNGIQAIVANSGNANCSTGEQGLRDAKAMCFKVEEVLGIDQKNVAVASTGIIGKYMDTTLVKKQIEAAARCLGRPSLR